MSAHLISGVGDAPRDLGENGTVTWAADFGSGANRLALVLFEWRTASRVMEITAAVDAFGLTPVAPFEEFGSNRRAQLFCGFGGSLPDGACDVTAAESVWGGGAGTSAITMRYCVIEVAAQEVPGGLLTVESAPSATGPSVMRFPLPDRYPSATGALAVFLGAVVSEDTSFSDTPGVTGATRRASIEWAGSGLAGVVATEPGAATVDPTITWDNGAQAADWILFGVTVEPADAPSALLAILQSIGLFLRRLR